MKTLIKGALGFLAIAGSLPLVAQSNGEQPAPKVLQIYREIVKPGHNAAHEKVEVGWPKAYRASKKPGSYLAMASITGANEAWFVAGYDSYDAWEKQTKSDEADKTLSAEFDRLSAADSEHLDGARSITAIFREDLSLRPALNIGDYRYMNVVTVRVKPGFSGKYAEMRKAIKAAHEKTGMKDYFSVFEVTSGMQGPAFLVFVPMKSLKEADEARVIHVAPAYLDALGGEARLAEMSAATITSSESTMFRFSPKMSMAPANYSIGNGDFWSPKNGMEKVKMSKETKKQ